uniref:Phorbol-ester/DAG-type domain-containing protein n=1 Tax=Anopheles coluzzii TaxID=1518534 RepID=A0A6E8W5R8_ANOCL
RLADQIDDYICVFEGAGDLTMDTFVMLLFALIVVVISLVFATKLIYDKYVLKKGATATGGTADGVGTAATVPAGTATPLVSAGVTAGTRVSEPKEVLSKKVRKGRVSGTGGMGGGGGGARGGGGFGGGAMGAASGPTIARKRISRMSPGPEAQKKRPVIPPSNINGTDPQITQWAIHLFRWLYSDLVVVNKLLQDWVATVNTALLTHVEQHEMIVEVVRVLPESLPPNMSSILCEPTDQPNEVELLFDVDATPVLQIKAFNTNYVVMWYGIRYVSSFFFPSVPKRNDRLLPSNLPRSDLSNHSTELLFEVYDTVAVGNDKTTSELREGTAGDDATSDDPHQVPSTAVNMASTASMPDVVDSTTNTRSETSAELPPVDNGSDGVLATVAECPKASDATENDPVEPLTTKTTPTPTVDSGGDEPACTDTNQSKLRNAPFFTISSSLHTAGGQKFLGLGLVGIDELASGPATTQILELQPRPYETETITGSLTVEVVLERVNHIKAIEDTNSLHCSLFSLSSSIHHRSRQPEDSTPSSLSTRTECPTLPEVNLPTIMFLHSSFPCSVFGPHHTILITDHFCTLHLNSIQFFTKMLYHMHESLFITHFPSLVIGISFFWAFPYSFHNSLSLPITYPKNGFKSIIESFQSSPFPPPERVINVTTNKINNIQKSQTATTTTSFLNEQSIFSHIIPRSILSSMTASLSNSAPVSVNSAPPVKKPRNIFGTLRNKLTPSKKSKSLDVPQYSPTTPGGNVRSASSTLSRGSRSKLVDNACAHASSLSLLMYAYCFPPGSNIFRNLSRKSSISESSAISGLSTGSGRTYVHEESTLLLETTENNVVRHYLVPLEVATKQKNWKRKGTKLHIYNDHTFVAKHIPGLVAGILCFVCNRSIPRRPGKQGYECRDCAIQCHKPCHVRAPQACPNPKILSMQL